MLVVISDLHFTDGTSSNETSNGEDAFNVKAGAFSLFFSEIVDILDRNRNIASVTLVLDGDICDLLRTHAWFGVKDPSLPWSVQPDHAQLAPRCETILQNICRRNAESMAWLSGEYNGAPFTEFDAMWPKRVGIRRVLLPGNHDRLVARYPSCWQIATRALLGAGADQPVMHQFTDAAHRTIVLHGHEADAFNCELDAHGAPAYLETPIGDPMTTMLFTRLGYEAERAGMPPSLVAALREVDNVRPELDAVRYVQNVASQAGLDQQISEIADRIVTEFKALPYYGKWHKQHDGWGFDEADKLSAALGVIQLLGTHIPIDPIERVFGLSSRSEDCERLAVRRLTEAGTDFDYCVLGHTHEPFHLPVAGGSSRQKHYLNSGTFRSTFARTAHRDDFVQFQRLSYIVIYAPGELYSQDQGPMWEMWSGRRGRF